MPSLSGLLITTKTRRNKECETMSSIDDEIVRAKMRKLRVSTFADIFYEVVNDEAYADALPEDIFLAAVEEAYTQRQQRNIAKAITPG